MRKVVYGLALVLVAVALVGVACGSTYIDRVVGYALWDDNVSPPVDIIWVEADVYFDTFYHPQWKATIYVFEGAITEWDTTKLLTFQDFGPFTDPSYNPPNFLEETLIMEPFFNENTLDPAIGPKAYTALVRTSYWDNPTQIPGEGSWWDGPEAWHTWRNE